MRSLQVFYSGHLHLHGFKNVAILNVLVGAGFMVPLVADWFQSDNFFEAVEYALHVQDSVK